jgi:hypothetical protein
VLLLTIFIGSDVPWCMVCSEGTNEHLPIDRRVGMETSRYRVGGRHEETGKNRVLDQAAAFIPGYQRSMIGRNSSFSAQIAKAHCPSWADLPWIASVSTLPSLLAVRPQLTP